MTPPRHKALHTAKAYLTLLLKTQGRRVVLYLGLAWLVGLSGGVSVLMLVPLLELVGIGELQNELASGFSAQLTTALSALGLSLSLGVVLISFVGIVLISALLNRWLQVVQSQLECAFTKQLQDRLFTAITRCQWDFFIQSRGSDFTHALTSNLDRVSGGTFYLLRLVSAVFVVVVHIGLAITLSPSMSLICLGCFLVLWRVLGSQNVSALRAGERVTALTESFYSQVTEHLAGMKEVKSMGADQLHIDAFDRATDEVVQTRMSYTQTVENTRFAYTAGSAAMLAGLLYAAKAWLRVPLGELSLLIFIFSRLIPKLRNMHVCYQQILNVLPALESAFDLQQRCEASEGPSPVGTTAEKLQFQQAIELRGVSYRYPDETTWALQDIDLTIPARSTLAIVGPSGAGKSTLADLLLGLLPPASGEVLLDGVRLDGERLAAWRDQIGYVPQSTFLLHDTIRRNLLWALPSASATDLQEALQLASADGFTEAFPQGIETVVGDRGVRLSGGERQRIALARALLRRPEVLIMDEATSALDAENQHAIQSAIRKLHGELTVIIIAHRLSAVQTADRIVVLDAGRIAEMGTFDELAGRDGRFRALMAGEGFDTDFSTATGRRMD